MFQRMEDFVGATAINLLMGYYHLELDEHSQKLCTMVIMPDGKYAYQRMPMGCCCGSDYFQEVMTNIFANMDFVLVYLDDVLII